MGDDLSIKDSTVMLPDGSELNLGDLTEDELLELYHNYETGLISDNPGTLVGGGFLTTLHSCLGPTTWQTMEMAGKLFSICLILRVVTLLRIPTKAKHLASSLCGVAAFEIFYGEHSVLYHFFALLGLGYGLLFAPIRYKGAIICLFCVVYLLTW